MDSKSKTTSMRSELLKLVPSNEESRVSGGTANELPLERAKASFDVQELIHFLNGGEDYTKKRKFVESYINKDIHEHYNLTRSDYYKQRLKEFVEVHKKYKNYKPTRYELLVMGEMNYGMGGLGNSHNFFLLTIIGQGNEEQQAYWIPKIMNFELTGAYAQTELGHGSNVRGIETTAIFDSKTDEFVLNTPTLRSIKWWPGALGKVSTHVVLMAQLLLDGKEKGVFVFVVQIRDENHAPLPGINIGDLGNKMGDNANDTGFMSLENVRIPRTNMLSKFQTVTREGKLVTVLKASPQVHYSTMTLTRASMIFNAGSRLCQASTIAIRYSCVRKQGFKSFEQGISFKSEEQKLVDHKIQQYRLFKQLANAYALKFIGRWIAKQVELIEGGKVGSLSNMESLKEVAMASAGLKSLCTQVSSDGIEDLRKCCGGNGYLLNSGIASLRNEYLLQVTAEGDMAILAILSGKFLVQTVEGVKRGVLTKGFTEYLNVLANTHASIKSFRPANVKNHVELLNVDFLLQLFKYKAISRCAQLHEAFVAQVEKGTDLQAAFEELAIEASKASYAHCYYIIISNFIEVLKEVQNLKILRVLTRLCIFFGLCNINDDNWGDILDQDQFRFVKTAINVVMSEIRPDCIALVDGFDYSDYTLKSTIGRYDGNVYEALYDAAQNSTLNKSEVFEGFSEVLKPVLNKKLLEHGNKPLTFHEKF